MNWRFAVRALGGLCLFLGSSWVAQMGLWGMVGHDIPLSPGTANVLALFGVLVMAVPDLRPFRREI